MTKTCAKCGRELPATAEFFYVRKSDGGRLREACKECVLAKCASYRAEHAEAISERRKVLRNARRSAHREEFNARRALYREQHKDRLNAANRRRYAANPAKECARKHLAFVAHPEKYLAWTRNYRARALAALGSHTAEDIAQQFERQSGLCYWCGQKVGRYHVDHVIPLAKGGSNGPENLVIACASCNHSKGAKLPHEFSDKLC